MPYVQNISQNRVRLMRPRMAVEVCEIPKWREEREGMRGRGVGNGGEKGNGGVVKANGNRIGEMSQAERV
jgi:hypothetical protein